MTSRLAAIALISVVLGDAISAQQTLRDRAKVEDQSQIWTGGYEPVTLEMLVERADTIVVGHIQLGRPALLADNDSVVTYYHVEIDSVIRRTKPPGLVKGEVLQVRRHGGTMELEGHVLRATEMGFAQFAASESYLFFLAQRKNSRTTKDLDYYEVSYGPQGAFRLDTSTNTVRPMQDQFERWPKDKPIALATVIGEVQRIAAGR